MRLKLSLLLVFIITYSWSQSSSTKTFNASGTFPVPAGVTGIIVQAWGGGGSGGGASGAPLLLGRGAAGGGGGAYATAPLAVTPGSTLNVIVAGQTSGTSGANGTTGGNSTITGFESSILAAGGSGGAANNAGGTPIGGNGGLVANSVGTTRLAGLNGGNGNSWNLLGILLSSGAGGAGANFGGAGGAAVSGLILSNAPGSSGSAPGGGGSGGINSALGVSQVGGAGAGGRVIISYSCSTFSLTNTAATNVCVFTGTTSTVTLSANAASLPVGNYVVTYNRSSPSGTALTANLTVSTAGTGTFTAIGLTTAGSSIITITKLASETCSSTISANNTAIVIISPAAVGGTVNGGTTINAGNASGLLTLSGHTGSVVKWQSSVSPFSTWTDIANTNTTYTSGALTQTTQFRAVVQSGVCSVANSAATTVTVNPLPTIALASSAAALCTDPFDTPTTLNYSATTGAPITYSIVWNSSPPNTLIGVTDAVLPASPITADIRGGTPPGIYTGTLTVKNASGVVSSPGSVFTVTVNETPLITTSGTISSVCASTNSQNATLVYSGVSGNPTGYFIDWNSTANAALLADQGNTSFAFAPGGGGINTIQIPANVPAGTYLGLMNIFNGLCDHYQLVTLTVNPATIGGTVNGGTTICTGTTSSLLTLSGHTGSVVKWQSSVSPFSTWTDIANTNTTYTSGALTETTQFRAVVQSGTCDIVNSDVTTVTVNPLPTIFLRSSDLNICNQENDVELPYHVTGSPVSYSIVWNTSPTNHLTDITDRVISENGVYFLLPAGTLVETYTGTVTVKDATGCVSPGESFNINVVAPPTITINTPIHSVCTSANLQYTTLEYLWSTGSATNYSIDWDDTANAASLEDQSSTSYNFIGPGGYLNTIQISANAQPGTYSGRIFFDNGLCSGSELVSITISPVAVGGTVSGGTTICSGTTSSLLTLSDHTGSVVKWQSSVSPFSEWTDITNSNATYTSAALTETTQFRAVISNGTCQDVDSDTTTVTVNPSPIITLLSPDIEICEDDIEGPLGIPYTATGSPVSYSIVWNASTPGNSSEDITDAVLSGNSVNFLFSNFSLEGTYTGVVTVKDATGCVSPGSNFSVNVIEKPEITTTGIIDPVTTSTSTQNASLSYTASSGAPINFAITWDSGAFPYQGSTLFNPSPTGGVINTIQIPASAPAGTYTGILNIFNDTDCDTHQNISVTIQDVPTITLDSAALTVCSSNDGSSKIIQLSYSGTTGNPTTYSIVWNSSPTNNFVSVTDAALPASPIQILVPGGILGTFTGTLTVKNPNGGVSSPGSVFTVTINETPLITTSGTISSVCESTNSQNVTLAYSGVSGSPIEYSIDWNSIANSASLADQGDTPFSFEENGGIINTIQVSPNVQPGTYFGLMNIFNGICNQSQLVSITVNPLPTITLLSPDINICQYDTASPIGTSYTATGSPVSYSIVWNTSDPANGSEDITDAVLSGNSVNFLFSNAAFVGTYTGTITVKDETGCVSPGAVFTVNVLERPEITTTGIIDPVTTSTSTQDVTLPYTASSGVPTSYSVSWDSEFFSFQEEMSFAFSPTGGVLNTIQIPANVPAGTYTGTIRIFNENNCDTHQSISITVEDVPSITLETSVINICKTGGFVYHPQLPYNLISGSPVTYSITWAGSPGNNLSNVIDATLTEDFVELTIPVPVYPGVYNGEITVKDATGNVSSPLPFTLKIDSPPSILTEEIVDSVFANSASQNSTLVYTGISGRPISYSIDWNAAANESFLDDQPITPYVFDNSGGVIDSIIISGNAQPGTYSGTLYIKGSSCTESYSISVTINPEETFPTITLASSAAELCPETFETQSPLEYSATTGSPTTYSIVWNSSPTNTFEEVFEAALPASPITIDIPAETSPGTYTGTLTVKNENGGISEGSTFEINVIAPATITTKGIINAVTTSTSAQNATLSYTASVGNPTKYSISWDTEFSPFTSQDETFFSSSPTGGVINTIAVPANAPPGTYQGYMQIFNEKGCISDQKIFITINASPTITTSASAEPVCANAFDNYYTSLSYSATTGSPVTYSIVWNSSPTNNLVEVTDAELYENQIFIDIPAGTDAGTYTGTLTVKDANGVSSLGSIFTVTIIARPSVNRNTNIDPVCASSSLQYGNLEYYGTSGNPTGYYIDWDPTANNALLVNQPYTPFVFSTEGGTINTIEIPANVPDGVHKGVITFSNGSCINTFGTIVLTISPAVVGGTVSGGSTIASGNTSNLLTLEGNTGSVIFWQSATSPFDTWVDIDNTSTTYVSEELTETTKFRAFVLSGPCGDAASEPTTVTVQDLPTIALSEFADSLCEDDFIEQNEVHQTALAYTGTTGNPTTYSIVWDSLPANNFPAVTDAVLPSSPITITVPAAATAGTYKGTLTVKDANGISSSGSAFSVTINEPPAVPIIGEITGATTEVATGSVAFSGLPLGSWGIVTVNGAQQGLVKLASGESTVVTGLVPGNYIFRVFNTATNCSSGTTETVTVPGATSERPISKETPSARAEDLESAKNPILVSALNKVINVETPNQVIDKVYIFDVSGNLIYQKNGVSDSKLSIGDLRSSNQVLVVRVVLNNKHSEIRKVIF